MSDYYVGRQVVVEPMGNFVRMGYKPRIDYITKIGRKYYYVGDLKFDQVTDRTVDDTNQYWVAWLTVDEYHERHERDYTLQKVRAAFRDGLAPPLDMMREICRVLGIAPYDRTKLEVPCGHKHE